MKHTLFVIIASIIFLLTPACSTALPVIVYVAPNTANVASGGTLQFTATVINTSNTAVTWFSCAGSITQTGLFTAPVVSAKTSVCVYAVSQAEPSSNSTAFAFVSPTSILPGTLALSSQTESFGSVVVGASQQVSERLTNTGGSSVDISGATVSGAAFQLQGITVPMTLEPSQGVTFNLVFTPQTAGEVSGSFAIASDASNPMLNASVSGTGVLPGTLQATPAILNFGNMISGGNTSLAETVSNIGGVSVTISNIDVTGSGFTLRPVSTPITLAPGQSTTVDVVFEPSTMGISNGSIAINSTASNSSLSVPLSGNGTGVPIAATNFGMQCGIGDPIHGQTNCHGSASTPIVWPTTGLQAQPGLLRLHDAGTYWSQLNPSSGTYDFTDLDEWLDLIAQHQPIAVSQVFTWVPCWDTVDGSKNPNCGIDPNAPTGTNYPPIDVTSSGSATFNDFVTNFVQHCSPAGNCVGDCPPSVSCASTNLIQFYEMWNEWDISYHWLQGAVPPNGCGLTMAACAQLLYQMVAPAAAIIRANVANSVILMPSATPASSTYQCDFLTWLDLESANAILGKTLSDWIAWHVYLTAADGSSTVIPEDQWTTFNQNFLDIQSGGKVSGCSAPPTTAWTNVPWANTETNFSGSATVDYHCPAKYSPDDCTGQIVRWQILHDSIGTNGPNNAASGLFWYYWLDTVGSNSQYETAYYNMMQYLRGGYFTGAASSTMAGETQTWIAPFVEANGTNALWVWTPNEDGAEYTVPSGYDDYRDLDGNINQVFGGQQITITVMPILLEQNSL